MPGSQVSGFIDRLYTAYGVTALRVRNIELEPVRRINIIIKDLCRSHIDAAGCSVSINEGSKALSALVSRGYRKSSVAIIRYTNGYFLRRRLRIAVSVCHYLFNGILILSCFLIFDLIRKQCFSGSIGSRGNGSLLFAGHSLYDPFVIFCSDLEFKASVHFPIRDNLTCCCLYSLFGNKLKLPVCAVCI